MPILLFTLAEPFALSRCISARSQWIDWLFAFAAVCPRLRYSLPRRVWYSLFVSFIGNAPKVVITAAQKSHLRKLFRLPFGPAPHLEKQR
jgi:hypothetical protein